MPCGGVGGGGGGQLEREILSHPDPSLRAGLRNGRDGQPGASVAAYPSRQSRFSCRLALACLPVRRFWAQGWC